MRRMKRKKLEIEKNRTIIVLNKKHKKKVIEYFKNLGGADFFVNNKKVTKGAYLYIEKNNMIWTSKTKPQGYYLIALPEKVFPKEAILVLDSEHGKKVVEYFVSIGGSNIIGHTGKGEGLYYYIDKSGLIYTSNVILKGYTLITLPEENEEKPTSTPLETLQSLANMIVGDCKLQPLPNDLFYVPVDGNTIKLPLEDNDISCDDTDDRCIKYCIRFIKYKFDAYYYNGEICYNKYQLFDEYPDGNVLSTARSLGTTIEVVKVHVPTPTMKLGYLV